MEEDPAVYQTLASIIICKLIPNLFDKDKTDNMHQELLSNPIRHGGAAITKLVSTAPVNLHTSKVCTAHISSALMCKNHFNRMDHRHVMAARKTAAKATKDTAALHTLNKIIAIKGPREAKTLSHAGKTV